MGVGLYRAAAQSDGPTAKSLPVQAAKDAPPGHLKSLVSGGLVLSIGLALAVWLMGERLADIDPTAVWDAMAAIPASHLALALVLTAVSYLGISFYDVLAFRWMGQPVAPVDAMRSGFVAMALSQTLGFGAVVGMLARWRMYAPMGIGPAKATLLSGMVFSGFGLGLAAIWAVAVALDSTMLTQITGLSVGAVGASAGAALILVISLFVCSVLLPGCAFGGRLISLPPPRLLLIQIGLAFMDVVPAALALWVLLPADAAIPVLAFLPVYLAAMMIGLFSNAPAGLGAFDAACFLALPSVGAEGLLASLLAFRVIYYGMPATLAGLVLIAGGRAERRGRIRRPRIQPVAAGDVPTAIRPLLACDSRAEPQRARSGTTAFLLGPRQRSALMVASRGNSLIVFGDPLGNRLNASALMWQMRAVAAVEMRTPFVVEASAPFSAALRHAGYHVVRMAPLATVDLDRFTLDDARLSDLRQTLGHLSACGVTLHRHGPKAAPVDALGASARCWSRGRRRTTPSMGRFHPDCLGAQRVIEARQDGRSLGFVSLMASGRPGAWGLDLLRLDPDAPDGVVRALVAEAIAWAQAEGQHRLSLGTARRKSEQGAGILQRGAARWLRDWHRCPPEISQEFASHRAPRYLAAPSRGAILAGLVDMAVFVRQHGDVHGVEEAPHQQTILDQRIDGPAQPGVVRAG